MKLTEKRIRDMRPGRKTIIAWDDLLKGLGYRLTPAGAGAFILDYRVDGRRRRATLGRVHELNVTGARAKAAAMIAGIREGDDPMQRRQDARTAPTVADGLDRFFGEFVPRRQADGRLGDLTIRDYRRQTRATVRPKLGPLKIRNVTRHDIEKAVADLPPVGRNRTLAFVSRLFSAFEDWEWRDPYTNPARRIEKAREEARDRTLTPSEIAALGTAMATCTDPFAAGALRFLLVTGWRVGEVLTMQWDHVDFETAEIRLPRTKTGRDVRAVGGMALEVVAAIPPVHGNPFVFAGGRGALTYHALRRRFKAICETAGIEDAKIHDIRRTVATSAAASGVSVFMLRDLLNHKTVAMANRYARRAGTALQQTQDAVGGQMLALLDGKPGAEVTSIEEARARRGR